MGLTIIRCSLTLTRPDITILFHITSFRFVFHQDGETALMSAADNGHLETVTLLLDRGADINQKDNVSYCYTWLTALYTMALLAHINIDD